jgi:hypothetical protein
MPSMPVNKEPYTSEEHMHRYACWAAARAAQRGWKGGNAVNIKAALEEVGLRGKLRKLAEDKPDAARYQCWHSTIANELIQSFNDIGLIASYGRVAKIIAIYVKTVYVAKDPLGPLSMAAYPPVDRELLMAVKRSKETPPYEHGLSWTGFTEKDHDNAIAYLRRLVENRPFWEVERYWRD